MLKINYTFRALQPLHTGSDENLGILRTLRREKTLVRNPQPIYTRFLPEQKRLKRQAVALLLVRLWDKMENKGRVTIYEEVASKLLSSTAVRTKEEFLQTICRKLEIREMTTDANRRFDVIDILELFDDYELLDLIRRESQYIMAMFRKIKDENIAWMKAKGGKTKVAKETILGGEDEAQRSPEVLIQDELMQVYEQPITELFAPKSIDYVPAISGNSIRGLLRRLVMADFCRIVGIGAKSLAPSVYHQLFTGGGLDKGEGNGLEDIGQREEMIAMCPMLGLFGSAIGKQTIQGALKVGQARLMCLENGNGELSYHDQIDVTFGTRLDTSKLDNEFSPLGEDKATHQMKYEYEVFCVGSEFEHSFGCVSESLLVQSAFGRMLQLFIEQNYIVAKSSVGHGEVDLSQLAELYECTDGLGSQVHYLEYLRENAEAIRAYWCVKEEAEA